MISLIYPLATALLLGIAIFFSVAEGAFRNLSRGRLKSLTGEGVPKAALALSLFERIGSLISTTVFVRYLVTVSALYIAFIYLVYGATIPGVVIILLFLIGELTGKAIAKEDPERFALATAPILRVFMIILTPLTFCIEAWRRLIAKLLRLSSKESTMEEELITMVETAETEGGIDARQSELIQNAIEFNDLEAYDVLTPRVDMVAIEVDAPKEEVAAIFLETGFSRLPVYEDSLDKVVGILNQKDFHNYVLHSDKLLAEYVKPVVFMAGSISVSDLLRKMQKVKTHMAIIVDEYGGTEGLVTMEDIIEELVGEIFDEHDEITTQEIIQMQDGSYRVLAAANLEKMFDSLDMELEEEFDATTVNGWVMIMLDKLPEIGDSFTYKNLNVRVTRVEKRKAIEVNIVKVPPEL